jgi:hypothetical protein
MTEEIKVLIYETAHCSRAKGIILPIKALLIIGSVRSDFSQTETKGKINASTTSPERLRMIKKLTGFQENPNRSSDESTNELFMWIGNT